MDMSDTMTQPKYDPGHYPVSGHNTEPDGRKRWTPMPLKARKDEAIRLVNDLLSGHMKAEALYWVRRRRYTPGQLENFIASMQRGIAAREERANAGA